MIGNKRLIPNVYNKGFLGIGVFGYKHNAYKIWIQMLRRCYSNKLQLIHNTYIGCSVDERWFNFQNFAEWYEKNYIDGYHLDKDILIKGNKIYGPDTCCFVPSEINVLFTKSNKRRGNLPIGVSERYNNGKFQVSLKDIYLGTYNSIEEAFNVGKNYKENKIREIAEIWKNKINPLVYHALINYKVEITD